MPSEKQEIRVIPTDATWRVVSGIASVNLILAAVYIIRNSLELAGILPVSGWTSSSIHYVIGFSAAIGYITAIILLFLRQRAFFFVYIAAASTRIYFWISQAAIEGFPILLGFVALSVDAMVLMTSMRWYLRKPGKP